MSQENQKATTEVLDIEAMFAKLKEEEKPTEEITLKKEDVIAEFFPEDETLKKEEDKEKKEEVVIEATIEENATYNKLQDYINAGLLSDMEVQVGEGDDAKVIFLSDYKDITPEDLPSIIEAYKKAQDEEKIEKLYEGLDARTRKMIELKKAGGDINELIQAEVQYTNALAGLDLDSEEVQESLVRQKLQGQGLHPKVINAQIEAMKEDVILDLEAKKIVDEYNVFYDKFVEDKNKEQLESITKEKEEQKEFRKNIGQVLRDYNLPENISKVVLDNSTKVDEHGLTNTDKLYFEAKNDPKEFAELAFYLNNKEEFKKFIGVKVKNQTTIKEVGKILKVNPKNIKTEVQPPITEGQKKEELLQEFFKQ